MSPSAYVRYHQGFEVNRIKMIKITRKIPNAPIVNSPLI